MFSGLIYWLHTHVPSPVLLQLGPVTLYWYGFFYAVSIALGYWLIYSTLKKQQPTNDREQSQRPPQLSNSIELDSWQMKGGEWQPANRAATLLASLPDLAFLLVVTGLIGARFYHVLNEPSYYWAHPSQIIAIWNGGLAIHGALIADIIFLWFYSKRFTTKLSESTGQAASFLWLLDLLAPAVLLGQAIGRWGNYFNQELFGYPTSLPWGIPISLANRPPALASAAYFHPTFLYESLWDAIGVVILLAWQRHLMKAEFSKREYLAGGHTAYRLPLTAPRGAIFFAYLAYMALGRFLVELLRIDTVPAICDWRLPLCVSLGLVAVGLLGCGIVLTRQDKAV